nr:hypothetical protein HK105_005455 [Polyrhizophydium stewartii]
MRAAQLLLPVLLCAHSCAAMSARLSYLVREAANVTGQVVNTASTLGSAKRLALALASGNTLSLSQTTSAGVRRANTSVEILAFSGVLPPNAGGLDPAGEPEQSDQLEPPDVFKDSGPASGKMIDLEKAPEPALSTLPRPVRSQPASPRRSILSWKWGPETGAGSNRFSVIKSP